MADASEHTLRIHQPTIAFHQEATVAIGANDLARELFRQNALSALDAGSATRSRSTMRPVARSGSGTWGVTRVARPSRLRAVLVCAVCSLIGVGVGHVVREGSAYASSMSAPAMARDAHELTTITAAAQPGTRAKDVASLAAHVAAKPARAKTRSAARPSATTSPAAHAPDAMFVDFEPSFRPAS